MILERWFQQKIDVLTRLEQGMLYICLKPMSLDAGYQIDTIGSIIKPQQPKPNKTIGSIIRTHQPKSNKTKNACYQIKTIGSII